MSCCDFHAGMLTERVTIERRLITPDGMGGSAESWAADPKKPIAANMRHLTGTEASVADRIAPTATVRCTIRFRGDADGNPYYTPSDRIIHRGRTFSILAAVNRRMEFKWLELLLQEGRPS